MTKNSISNSCIICDKKYKSYKKTSKFCGLDCYRVHQRAGNYKQELENNCTCDNCNKPFHRAEGMIENNIKNFCSRECYQEDHKTVLHKVQCFGCKKEFELSQGASRLLDSGKQTNFYCSNDCRSNKDKVNTCIECGCEFCSFQYRKANNPKGFTIIRSSNRTCSKRCQNNFYKNNEARKEKISIAFSGPKHPNYVNGCSKNDRIRKTEFKETFSNRDKRALYLLFDNKCFKCGSNKDLCMDHHLPFSRGGRLTRSNAVILCRKCNSSKNAKMPDKFYSLKELNKLDKMGINHNNIFNFIF